MKKLLHQPLTLPKDSLSSARKENDKNQKKTITISGAELDLNSLWEFAKTAKDPETG